MEFQRPLCLFVCIFITLISSSQATKFSVVWTPNPSESYSQWSGRNRFQVNDTIVFKYQKGSDSVLEVKKEDYDKCNKTNPIQKFEGGDTEFKFDRSGPFYFISGKNGSCENGQKLIVVVISPRTTTTKSPPSPAPVATSPSMSPAATPPSSVSTPPSGGPSPASGSTSPSPSPSISTPPAGGPSPASSAPESTTPSPSPKGSSPTGEPLAPGAPSGSAMGPGSENSPDSSNATAPPPGSGGSFVTPSRFLVLSVTVVGAAFMRY